MLYIGSHTSIAGGLENAAIEADSLGASAFGMFTKNQRQWATRPITEEQSTRFKEMLASLGFTKEQVLPHGSYLINLGNPDGLKRRQSLDAFIDELSRVGQLGLDKLNFHPGAHVNMLDRTGSLKLVSEALDEALQETEGVMPIIETTAGQGSTLGSSFEEIEMLLNLSRYPERLGVCIDTCHIFAAGYDIRGEEAFAKTFELFDRVVGFANLRGMHLNDAKIKLGSRLDRHESLGKGEIGLDPFIRIVQDERFMNIPLILETIDSTLWKEEIALLKASSQKTMQ
ncbi:deoxyribonuclease IV [Sphaerochaeta sp. PS]|uniref:deoxyribonuclease IV n=1 Tax=Sphaerochaeta sp. PS TaxID=3076336 RepID=UPI0028A4DE37|nr:deoxyribonuclease IV [Sphaerochaeta sp. PS]MDT4761203.1 deoxyribonuclease IV [Sphaerochaeta sp. PS]